VKARISASSWHLYRVYEVEAWSASNSYVARLIYGIARRLNVRDFQVSGAVMNDQSDKKAESPYSALSCILLLLATGILVKTGAALHLCHFGSCY